MKAHSIDWTPLDNKRSTRTLASRRPGSEKVCQVVDMLAKVFTAGVPAVALIIGTVWAATLPELNIFPQAAIWIEGIAILAVVPAAAWLYMTIVQLKEKGWA